MRVLRWIGLLLKKGRKTRIYLCPIMDEYKVAATVPGGDLESAWMPSIDWGQGGPLIDSDDIDIWGDCGFFCAHLAIENKAIVMCKGTTRLIAACRAIVAAKLGAVVSVPEELCQN